MANGLLEELRRIAESSKDIPQEAVNRLILSTLAELVTKVDKQTEVEETKRESLSEAMENVCDTTDQLNRQVTEINAKLTCLTVEIASLRSNPVIAVGRFVKNHPKSALFVAISTTMALFVLLSSRPFITLILTLAGVPSGAIEQILLLLSS